MELWSEGTAETKERSTYKAFSVDRKKWYEHDFCRFTVKLIQLNVLQCFNALCTSLDKSLCSQCPENMQCRKLGTYNDASLPDWKLFLEIFPLESIRLFGAFLHLVYLSYLHVTLTYLNICIYRVCVSGTDLHSFPFLKVFYRRCISYNVHMLLPAVFTLCNFSCVSRLQC